MKKTRLSFSSVSIEEDKSGKTNQTTGQATRPTYASPYTRIGGAQARGGEHRIGERKVSSKSSTYQYSKGGRGGGSGGNRSFNGKSQNKNLNESKIPVVEEGVIRIIPLGGVEEVGRNMILIESQDDIIVLDIGFHFIDEEEAMGADFTLPNFKYLEERKNKIRAVVITHGQLDHEKGKPTAKEEKKWGTLGKENNLLLIADSTSAEVPGFSIEEKEVQKNIEEIIRVTKGRLIIGTFASQFDRMIKIVEICERYNKKIVIEGRSM